MYLIYHQYHGFLIFNKATFLTFATTVNCAENRQLPELSAFRWSLACENRRFFLFSLIATSRGEKRGQTTVGCLVTIMCRVIQRRYLRYIQTFWGWIGAHIFSLRYVQLSGHGLGVTVQPIIDDKKNHSDIKIQLTGVISLLTAVTLIRENFPRWRQHCLNVGVLFVIISVKLTTFPLFTNTDATQEPLPTFNCIVNC